MTEKTIKYFEHEAVQIGGKRGKSQCGKLAACERPTQAAATEKAKG